MDIVVDKNKGSFNSLVPSNWITSFLKSRKLDHPDGRALFAYQVDQQEFHHIAICLSYSAALGIKNIDTRLPMWDALFVLYASEWWRRNYHGGAWSWESIITSLELSTAEFNHATTRSIVSKGLTRWKRELLKNGQGHQYLGTIIFEGGIPLGLLRQNSGFENFLRGVLEDSIQYAESGLTPKDFAQRRIDMLATAYHKDEFLILVGEVIHTVLSLRENNDLSAQKDPVTHLDNTLPQWRTLFPISIEGDEGNALINSLIVQSSKVKKKSDVPIYLKRTLKCDDTSRSLDNKIIFPKIISEDDLQDYWHIETTGNKLDIVAFNGANRINLAVLTLVRNGEYKVSSLVNSLPSKGNTEDWQVSFYRKGKVISELFPLKGGEVLEPDLPLGFELTNDYQWNFICQGNVSTSKNKLMVVLPRATETSQNNFNVVGKFEGDRDVIEVTDNSKLAIDDNEIYQFKVKLEHIPANTVYRIWSERKLSQKHTSIAVLIGAPRVTKIIGSSLFLDVPNANIFWRKRGGAWRGDLHAAMGLIDLGIFEENRLVYRKKAIILPRDLSISYQSHIEQFNRGEIIFISEFIRSATTNSEGVTYQTHIQNNQVCLDVCAEEGKVKELDVLLELVGCDTPVKVEFPFPTSGGRFIDVDRYQLKEGTLKTLKELNEIQLEVQHNDPSNRDGYYIDLTLVANDEPILLSKAKTTTKLNLEKQPLTDSLSLCLPMIDVQAAIKRLFSLSEDLDAFVKVSVRKGADIFTYIHVVRYSSSIGSEETASGYSLYLNDLEGVSIANNESVETTLIVKALHFPEERGFELKPIELNGVDTNQWLVPYLSKHNGPWLVFEPKENSKIRPKLIISCDLDNECEQTKSSLLRSAIVEINTLKRENMLDIAIQNLANDTKHNDWLLIDAYINEFNKLPLTTFDLWDRFIKNELAMAELYLRYIDDQTKALYIDHFAEELPFIWESISANVWAVAFKNKKHDLESVLKALPNGHVLLVEQCLKWLDNLSSLSSTSTVVVKFLKHEIMGQQDKLFSIFSSPDAAKIANNILMAKKEDSHYQKLVRRSTEESWPSLTDELTERLTQNVYPHVVNLLQLIVDDLPKWRSSVVLTPLLLGIHQAQNNDESIISSSIDILSIRNIILFDKEWFATAYHVGFAYALGFKK